jgi:hypothetical protein
MKHNWYVCSYDYNFDEFVAKYPDINDWFKVVNENVGRMKRFIEQRKSERLSRNSGVVNFK